MWPLTFSGSESLPVSVAADHLYYRKLLPATSTQSIISPFGMLFSWHKLYIQVYSLGLTSFTRLLQFYTHSPPAKGYKKLLGYFGNNAIFKQQKMLKLSKVCFFYYKIQILDVTTFPPNTPIYLVHTISLNYFSICNYTAIFLEVISLFQSYLDITTLHTLALKEKVEISCWDILVTMQYSNKKMLKLSKICKNLNLFRNSNILYY